MKMSKLRLEITEAELSEIVAAHFGWDGDFELVIKD